METRKSLPLAGITSAEGFEMDYWEDSERLCSTSRLTGWRTRYPPQVNNTGAGRCWADYLFPMDFNDLSM
jgi:hypothetical protein